ncbi:MAG: orotate phosphoribosyltransferase [Wenzhouxiangellaceae bacterium]|nr:orotate phosphoribosyltransferase [Wenzhouxiangellaceae bacterium]
MQPWTRQFIDLALEAGALKFGRYTLKSGRVSPYFFNAGAFCSGRLLGAVADAYADAIVDAMVDAGVEFDLLFGPAYKGIPLAATVAASLWQRHRIDIPVAYNRKEAKDHGEGGSLVGAPLAGRVLVVDDVISAGTAFADARARIEQAGAHIVALAIGLDRQERAGDGMQGAARALADQGIRVVAVARLDDLIAALQTGPRSNSSMLSAMLDYRERYGVGS